MSAAALLVAIVTRKGVCASKALLGLLETGESKKVACVASAVLSCAYVEQLRELAHLLASCVAELSSSPLVSVHSL